MTAPRLSSADRTFFQTLADIVFGNPFNLQRAVQLLQLVPEASGSDPGRDREALAHVVLSRLTPWMGKEVSALKEVPAHDRRLLEPALLFVCYNRYVPQLDALIEQQVAQGSTPLPVPFGSDIIADLVQWGFTKTRAVHYVALFFQVRRAFYFIDRSLPGKCESMQRLREALWNNVFTHDMRSFEVALWNRMEDFSTVLLGETGTGKGSAASAIGRSGFIPYLPDQRRFAANFTETFIAVNLSQFPETLIESELFGHRKGAFTGALEPHQGVFERCSAHGALFLDEIGEATIPVQIKLLQVLQERTFTPLGSHEKKRFSGRVIVATNRPLGASRREGRLREDFFYRLCSDSIELPALRQRISESPEELEQLAQHMVTRIAGVQAPELVDNVLLALGRDVPQGYAWPGNVRELEQAVRRIFLTGHYMPDSAQAVMDEGEALVDMVRAGALTADELLARYCAVLYRLCGTYTEVAKRTGLDPRTSRKYVEKGKAR